MADALPLSAEEEVRLRPYCAQDGYDYGNATRRLWATLDAARAETKLAQREYRDAMQAVATNAEIVCMMQDQRDAARAERDEARGEREAAMRTPPAHTSVESPEAFVRGLWTGKAARGQNAEMVHERDAKVRAEGDAAGYARGVEEAAATRNLSDPLSMIHGIKAVPRG